MENTAVLNVRISEQLKQQLSKLAKEKNETVSDYVRELLTRHVLQGGDSVSGISPELREQIRIEAGRRKVNEARIVEKALCYAFSNLRVSGLWQW
ncbi:MAG: hypothetical protein ACXADB_13670 [Candidatus Hermodarchaeia archaeon]